MLVASSPMRSRRVPGKVTEISGPSSGQRERVAVEHWGFASKLVCAVVLGMRVAGGIEKLHGECLVAVIHGLLAFNFGGSNRLKAN